MQAALTLAHREILRFRRQPSRVVGAILPPLLAWGLVGTGFGTSFQVPGAAASGGYSSYFFPGTVVLVVLFAAIFSTISVIEDRREGFLQAVLVAPLSPFSLVAGKVLGGTALGMLQGGILLALLPITGFHGTLPRLATALLVLFLMAFALTGLGFSIAWMLESTQGFHAVMNLFLLPMWLLSGAFFPLHGAPPWLRGLMALNPLTYGVAALRRGLSREGAPGLETLPGASRSLLLTSLFALAMLALAAFVVVRNPTGPERRRLRSKK